MSLLIVCAVSIFGIAAVLPRLYHEGAVVAMWIFVAVAFFQFAVMFTTRPVLLLCDAMRKAKIRMPARGAGRACDPDDTDELRTIIYFFALPVLFFGLFWMIFTFFVAGTDLYDNPLWFIFGGILPFAALLPGRIHWSLAWIGLIAGYALLGWFGLSDTTAFAHCMKCLFFLWLIFGGIYLALMLSLRAWEQNRVPKYCGALRACIAKHLPPPEAVNNCSEILNDCWDEVRNIPDGGLRDRRVAALLTLIDKVANYGYGDDFERLLGEPELQHFQSWGAARAEKGCEEKQTGGL